MSHRGERGSGLTRTPHSTSHQRSRRRPVNHFYFTAATSALAVLGAVSAAGRATAETATGTPTYGVVSGHVTDREGNVVSGALVVIRGTNRFATSNAKGYYVISPVPPGTYDMDASRVGYSGAKKKDVTVAAGVRTSVDFALGTDSRLEDDATGLIEGNVVDVSGYPLKNVRVRVLETEDSVETDDDGVFWVGPLAPGFYTVRTEGGGCLYQTTRVFVEGGEATRIRFILWPDPRYNKSEL